MNKNIVLATLNSIVFAATLIVNYLSNALPINGKTTGQISDQLPVLFKPAGYVFSIWGVIYLGLIVFVVYQFFPKARNSGLMNIIGVFFIISCLANIAWLFAWHYERFGLSVLIMLVLLYSLYKIYTGLNTQFIDNYASNKWTVFVPFSIYFAWICVATIANISIFLYTANWNGFGIAPVVWLALLLIIGLGLGFFIFKRFNDIFFIFVLVWAYWGIAVQNKGDSTVYILSLIATILMSLVLLLGLFKVKF